MSITLHITFSGLCLFVPDLRAVSGRRMHVLFPATGGKDQHVRHETMLCFDLGHLRPDGTTTGACVCYDVRGAALEFIGIDALDVDLPASVLRIDDDVEAGAVNVTPTPLLDGRVTLGSGAAFCVAPGTCWKVGKTKARELTFQLGWAMKIAKDVFTLDLPATAAMPNPSPIQLYPTADSGAIRLFVFHVTRDELPMCAHRHVTVQAPESQDQASPHCAAEPVHPRHIDAYGTLVKRKQVPEVVYDSAQGCVTGVSPLPECPPLEFAGASSLSCMIAAARPLT
jgi:hypothetical protein